MYNPQISLDTSSSTSDSFLFSDEVLSNGGFLIYLLILVYCCLGLAVICDAYFVPAIQKLSHVWDLPPDIAGSTLMALGASVPELFASLIGVFITEDDIGTGSIIGSACFNLIAVPAACAFVAATTYDKLLVLSPFPIIRNAAFYSITILVLVLVIKDNQVDIPEATILLLMFVLYMAFMIYSAQIQSYFPSLGDSLTSSTSSGDSAIDCKNSTKLNNSNANSNNNNNHIHNSNNDDATNNNNNNNKLAITYRLDGLNSGNRGNCELTPLVATSNNNNTQQQLDTICNNLYPSLVTNNLSTPDSKCPSWAANYVFEANNQPPTMMLSPGLNGGIQLSAAQSAEFAKTNALNYGTIIIPNNHQNIADTTTNSYISAPIDLQIQQQHKINLNGINQQFDTASYHQQIVAQHPIIVNNATSSQPPTNERHYETTVITLTPNNTCEQDITLTTTATLIKQQHQQQYQQAISYDENNHECWVKTKWIMIPMLPISIIMRILTPRGCRNAFWSIWTFIVSIVMIGILTYIAVTMVHLFGQFAGIPESVAGITILSWGTGIPELIASIVLIKKTAQADMAICNAIGSNVIDLSFCLSLPWIIKCLINISAGEKAQVSIQSAALPLTSLTLLITVLALIFIFKCNKWAMTIKVGLWLTFVYLIFVIVACYLEYTFSDSEFSLLSP